MSVNEKASVEASLKGGDQVAKEAGKIRKSFEGIGDKAKTAAEKGVKALRDQIGGTITDSLRAASVLQTINLASGIESAKRFTAETSKLARMSGESFGSVGSKLESLESRTLTSADAVGGFARNLGRATYDAKSAMGAIGGLGDFALATGRDLEDGLDIGVTMRSSLGVIGDVLSELERVRSMGEKVGTKGGYAALTDTLAAIKPQLDQVAVGSDKARAELEALVAVSTKGLKPGMAQQVAGGMLSTIKARALDIERLSGHRVLDEQGNVTNPLQAFKDLKRIGEKKFGGDKEAMRRAYISEFGPDLGSAILRTDTDEVDRTANEKGKGKIAADADKARASDEAKRKKAQLEKEKMLRDAGSKVLGAESWLLENLGVKGTIAAGIIGPTLASKGVGALADAGIKGLFGSGAGGGGSSAIGRALATGAGAAALPITAMLGIGAYGYADIQSTAPDYENARKRDADDKKAAAEAGIDVVAYRGLRAKGAFGETGQPEAAQPMDPQAVRDMLKAIKGMPEATAAAIRGSNIVVRLPERPNKDKAN